MMAFTFSGYLSILGIFVLVKYTFPKFSIYIDAFFFFATVIVMATSNANTQKQVCGFSDSGVVITTMAPWTMLAIMMIVLRIYPVWRKPFANTVGHLVLTFANGGGKLRSVLEHGANWVKQTRLKTMMDESPYALLYEMGYKPMPEFQTTLDKLAQDESIGEFTFPANDTSVDELISVLYLRDLFGEMTWFLLVGMVAMTVSYNVIVSCNGQAKLNATA